MVELGRALGNFLGDGRPDLIQDILDLPFGQVKVFWRDLERTGFGTNHHFYLNRQRVDVSGLDRSENIVQALTDSRQVIELLTSGPFNSDEPDEILQQFLIEKIGGRVFLSWDDPLDPSDVSKFNVYGSPSGPLLMLGSVLGGERSFLAESLIGGTWSFRVNPVDRAGNELTSIVTASAVVPDSISLPNSPVAFQLITPTIGKVTWAGASGSVDSYRVYANNGSGFVNQTTPWAEVPSSQTFAQSAINAGQWIFIVRSVKSGVETINFDRRVEVVLGGSTLTVLSGLPNQVSFLSAGALASGSIRINVSYNAHQEASLGKLINIYMSELPSGPDFTAPPTIAIPIPTHALASGDVFDLTVDIGPFAEGVFAVVARVEDDNSNEELIGARVVVTTDTIPPADITGLTAEVL